MEGGLRFSPGDVAVVLPSNLDESVEHAIQVLGWSPAFLKRRFWIRPTLPGFPPSPSSQGDPAERG